MYKFIIIVLLLVIGIGLYDHNRISLMTEEQKQAVVAMQAAEKQKRLDKKQVQITTDLVEEKRILALSNTPWSEVKEDQYAEKFLADKTYLWFFLLLLPTLCFMGINSFNSNKQFD